MPILLINNPVYVWKYKNINARLIDRSVLFYFFSQRLLLRGLLLELFIPGAPLNMLAMELFTLDRTQLDKLLLKTEAYWNMAVVSVTFDRFH